MRGDLMVSGYVFLYRELLGKPIWINSTPEQCKILITLLLMANHAIKEWEWRGGKYKLSPGQFITSLESIVKKCGSGITIQNVRTALKRFEKLEFLTNESTKSGRLITVLNWRLYQVELLSVNRADNKDLTNDQQRPNKQLTPNKNDKNNKKRDNPLIVPLKAESKVQFAEFVSLTNAEYDALVAEHGEHGAKRMIEILDNYKGASGKKYRSDYRAILNWVIKRYADEQNGVVRLSKREQDDVERRRLTEEYDRQMCRQANPVVQSKLPAGLKY